MKKTAVVAGATGVIGKYIIDYFKDQEDWTVIGLARNIPEDEPNVRYISVNMLEPDEMNLKLSSLGDATHFIYAAYQDYEADPQQQVDVNLAMFKNTLDAIEENAPALERVILMQGAKAYGVHLGPIKTPAKETDARHMPPNFYYDQEDYMREAQLGKEWTWTILRPDVVCGFSIGKPMNLAMVIGAYAAISKELGLPLRFPGKAYPFLAQMTDATLLARCTLWAALEERCAFETFNVTNGDFFRWEDMWKQIADFFGMESAPPKPPISLTRMMADKEKLWQQMVEKYDLQDIPYQKLALWGFGDFIFNCDYDVMSDTTKLRKFGFLEFVDTEEMFLKLFTEFQESNVLPRI
ncbi:SDR family oxidoreductase [Planomicrobium sp. CPCC 101079]|uniref:SDR family oxidoreductase n=1 Tax=Planomicrobium sp. CPCC 101079 TaxID=2599618 RepID=UPI0011B36211|nr:SDR family oxidoreductase [Planomicrobium sp. CPCC 101079]TWT01570.1 SDR family oxidoreductase [Planomicrobium sp. CPCC 101079]